MGLSLDGTVDDGRLGDAVRRRAGPEVACRLRAVQEAVSEPLGRPKLLIACQNLHHIVKTLDHGT